MRNDCCYIQNPLRRDGTSQPQRFPLALAEDYVQIDERSHLDIINFLRRLSEEFSYYHGGNSLQGDWREFFSDDFSFVLGRISQLDLEAYRTEFYERFDQVIRDIAANPLTINTSNFNKLFSFWTEEITTAGGDTLTAFTTLIDEWYAVLPAIDQFESEEALYTFKNEVDEARWKLNPFMQKVMQAHYESLDYWVFPLAIFPPLTIIPPTDTQYSVLDPAWGVDVLPVTVPPKYYNSGDGMAAAEDILDLFKGVFDTFMGVIKNLLSRVPHYLEVSLNEYARHNPQNGLILAFIQLFEHARDHLNSLGRKQLLFHYEDVLRFNKQAAQPDQAALIFQLRKGIEQHKVDEGTLLKAGKDGDGNPLVYQTNREVVINQTSIEKIQTVFVERDSTDVVEGIYAAPVANSSDGQGEDLEGDEPKWHTFGEAQSEKTEGERTMPDATLGFAVSSPLFRMKEGKREVFFTFLLEPGSSPLLDNNLTAAEIGAIEADIAFGLTVEFTGPKGWGEATIETVFMVRDNTVPYGHFYTPNTQGDFSLGALTGAGEAPLLAVKVLVDETKDAVVPYDTKLHSNNYVTKSPVFRFSFDSDAKKISDLNLRPWLPIQNNNAIPLDRDCLFEGGVFRATQANPQVISHLTRIWEFDDLLRNKYTEYTNVAYSTGTVRYYDGKVYRTNSFVSVNDPTPDENPKWDEIRFDQSIYKYFETLSPRKLIVKVKVSGIRGLHLENDNGGLKSNKPFQPFGSLPVKGSRFLVGYQEAFGKRLKSFVLKATWQDPPGNFDTYYNKYGGSRPTNSNILVKVDLLLEGKWKSVRTNERLFGGSNAASTQYYDYYNTGSATNTVMNMGRDPNLDEPGPLSSKTNRGFLRMELTSPGMAFGHKKYRDLYVSEIVNQVDKLTTPTIPMPVPKEPYDPVIKELTLEYTSEEILDFTDNSSESFRNRIEQFFHLHPFGQMEVHASQLDGDQVGLVPAFPEEGYLFLGLAKLDPPSTLSVLFQLADGSAVPELERFAPEWSVLSNNQWVDLEAVQIPYDSSQELITSGVVQFELAKEINTGNTLMDGELHWIRAKVEKNTLAVHKAIEILPQAIEASWVDEGNSTEHLRTALPSGTIAGLKVNDPTIKKVSQPYASVGGKLPEESNEFLTRVSERLRHKSRSINIWDYERMVLEEFPSIYKVKCLNHTWADIQTGDDRELSPGDVTVVTIPDLRNVNAVNPFEPKTPLHILTKVDEFLKDHVSTWVNLQAANPLYEKVHISCKVGFVEGKDPGFYIRELDTDIKRFLSPWAFDQEEDIVFGGEIHRSLIINYIEQRDYVDFVVEFKMDQILTTESFSNVEEAVATTSRSILVSDANHVITSVRSSEVDCSLTLTTNTGTATGSATDCCNHSASTPAITPIS